MQNGRKQAGRLFFAKRRQKEAGMERDVWRLTEQFAFSDRVDGPRIPFAEEIHAKIETMRRSAVGKLCFYWGKKPYRQISFYDIRRLTGDDIPLEGALEGWDEP